jgi:hypothetical protein
VQELLVVRGINDIVGKVDQELSETALGGGIVAQNGGEGSIAEGFGQALAECLSCAGVVTQAISN